MNLPPVVLLHGLRHTSLAMLPLRQALTRSGWHTINIGYPSARLEIEELAAWIWDRITARLGEDRRPLDIVGHSMGCILTRIIAREHPGAIRRAVMLAPPNQGSELVDRFDRFVPARWIMGPAGRRLGTAANTVPNTLGPPDFEAGIIAGNRPDNPFSSRYIPGEEDGRVGVERTRLEGMADHIVVPHGHFFMMHKQDVIAQTAAFLEHGHFSRET